MAKGFGEVLRSAREARRWSQAQLAKATGYSPGYIGRMETGSSERPSRDAILTLARALEIDPLAMLVAADRDEPNDHAGQRPTRPTFEEFVAGQNDLKEVEKSMLVRLYRSYVGDRTLPARR